MPKRNKLITEFIKVFTRPQTRNPLGHSLQFAEMLAGDSVQLHDCMLHISLHPAIFRRPAALAWARGAAVLHTVCSVPVPRDLQIPAQPPATELSGVLKVSRNTFLGSAFGFSWTPFKPPKL